MPPFTVTQNATATHPVIVVCVKTAEANSNSTTIIVRSMLSRHLTKTVSRVSSLLTVHKSAAPLVQLQQVHLQLRRYKGEAGETVERLSPEEEKLATIAKPKYDEIYTRHVRMPDLNEIPQASFDFHSAGAAVYPAPSKSEAEELALNIRRKRLVYRSKQRGWLEVDLLLGTWASENVSTLSAKDLDEFEAFVNLETVDIYNVITLRTPVPESMVTPTGDGVVERIQAWARGSPLGKADPEKYKSVKSGANLI